MSDIFLSPGVRTPFVKGGGALAAFSALALSVPVAKTMAERARPDFLVWSQVIPDAGVSNIACELVFEADFDPDLPAFSTVLAYGSSLMGVIEAAGMVGRGGALLALVGGVETMSHVPIALSARSPIGSSSSLAEIPAPLRPGSATLPRPMAARSPSAIPPPRRERAF